MSFPPPPGLPPTYSTMTGVPSSFRNSLYKVPNIEPVRTPLPVRNIVPAQDLLPTYSQSTRNNTAAFKPKINITHSPNSWKTTRAKMAHHNVSNKPELDTERVKSIMDCSVEGIGQLLKEGYTFKEVENALPSNPNDPSYEDTRRAFLQRVYSIFIRLERGVGKYGIPPKQTAGGRTRHKRMTKRRRKHGGLYMVGSITNEPVEYKDPEINFNEKKKRMEHMVLFESPHGEEYMRRAQALYSALIQKENQSCIERLAGERYTAYINEMKRKYANMYIVEQSAVEFVFYAILASVKKDDNVASLVSLLRMSEAIEEKYAGSKLLGSQPWNNTLLSIVRRRIPHHEYASLLNTSPNVRERMSVSEWPAFFNKLKRYINDECEEINNMNGGASSRNQMTKRRRSGRRTRKGGAGNENLINVKRPKTIRIPVAPQNQVPISIPDIGQHIRNVEERIAQVRYAPRNPASLVALGSSNNQLSQIRKNEAELTKLHRKMSNSTQDLKMLEARLGLYRLNNSHANEANKIQQQINKLSKKK